ncbi:MAG: hypothetical protein OEQ13_10530, partial [Acidobacteriota bacterium]|nr:hypothetical protein [Acidobacteriota bacterium]
RSILLSQVLACAAANASTAQPAVSTPDESVKRPSIEEIVAGAEVATEMDVSVSDYLRDQTARAFGWTARRLISIGWIGTASRVLLWVLVVGVPPVLAWWLFARSRRASRAGKSETSGLAAIPLEEPAAAVDLRGRLEALISAGRHADALAVLWTYVAERLSGRGLGAYVPEMTNREFVVSVARTSPSWNRTAELEAFTTRLDRLLYAGKTVTPQDMDGLVSVADGLVA